jgi:uncharacterized membrane protein YkvA (DUF1232 family)
MLTLVLAVVISLAILWLAFVAALAIFRPKVGLRDAVRILPDLLLMLGGIAQDTTLPLLVRVRLWLLLFYLALPIDLVPDVIPIIGYADDAILAIWVVRSVVRRSGIETLQRHWPGTPEGLEVVKHLAGLAPPKPTG